MESRNSHIKKPMIIMLICVGSLFACIFLYKTFINFMIKRALAAREAVYTVTAMTADYTYWQTQQKYFGSVRAVQGINVTTELGGLIENIYFKSGDQVKKGDLLVLLNISADVAQLHSLEANAELAKVTLKRDQVQYKIQAISKATLDADIANFKNLTAQVEQQKATIEKKTIRAPFSGRIGITILNKGQLLNPGDTIAPLQQLDTVYEDFSVPQQDLPYFKIGQTTQLTVDAFPNQVFNGKITSMNPTVDTSTRNILVEATFANPKNQLLTGMFAAVTVNIGDPKRYITVPQTAISYNPYGNLAYVLQKAEKDKQGRQRYIATQRFVITGETRGNQITIVKGVKAGEIVVTSGGGRLSNKSKVIINNAEVPNNSATPVVGEG